MYNGKEITSISQASYCQYKEQMKKQPTKTEVSKVTATLLTKSSLSYLLDKTEHSY